MTCYNKPEMRAIASKLVYGVRLEKQHSVDSMAIKLLKANISTFQEKEQIYRDAVKIYDFTIDEKDKLYTKDTNKLKRKIKWIKVAWTCTTIFLAGTTTYFLIK